MYNESGQLEDEKSRIARFFVTSNSELALTRYRLDVGNFPTTEFFSVPVPKKIPFYDSLAKFPKVTIWQIKGISLDDSLT